MASVAAFLPIVPVYKEELNIRPFSGANGAFTGAARSHLRDHFHARPISRSHRGDSARRNSAEPQDQAAGISRRFGQPAAYHGRDPDLHRQEACVVMDVDLQDPPELIGEMYAKHKQGFDVVYAKHVARGEARPSSNVSSRMSVIPSSTN